MPYRGPVSQAWGCKERGRLPVPLPEMLTNCLCVGAGGCVGAVARYLLGLALPAHQSGFLLGTFAVNVAGAFAIAFIATWFLRNAGLDGRMLLFLMTGVCGGFTTFSSFTWESLQLIQRGDILVAGAYIVGSCALCLVAALVGQQLAARLCG